MQNPFTEDYYLRGKETGLSNYQDYRWIPEVTIPACDAIMRFLGIQQGQRLLDFGAATGNYVRAYQDLGVYAWGYDISEWAASQSNGLVSTTLLSGRYDFVIAKDVLEHVPLFSLEGTVRKLLQRANRSVLICVPVTSETDGKYVLEVDEMDSTHLIRWTLEDWLSFLQDLIDRNQEQFLVSASHRLPGLKEYGLGRHNGCAFFVLRRFKL